MKNTGTFSRIDDLGRVIIPWEIRRSLRIENGDIMDLYTTDEGEVIFKKRSSMDVATDLAMQLVQSMAKTTDFITAVTNRDTIIAVNGRAERDLLGRLITLGVENIIYSRTRYRHDGRHNVFADNENHYLVTTGVPIISKEKVVGTVLCIGDSGKANYDVEYVMASTAAVFLAKQLSP